jgi:SanA protein
MMLINFHINNTSEKYIKIEAEDLPHMKTVLVPGAYVYKNGILSHILEDRILKALELYKLGIVEKFILSGDHGQEDYDEVNSMKEYLLIRDVPPEDIFLDHAGFSTYDSVYRAKAIFQATELIIVSQEYHLPRAVYIARSLGLDAHGYISDRRSYVDIDKYMQREKLANVKAFFDVLIKRSPRYLGAPIPIIGDSRLSWD